MMTFSFTGVSERAKLGWVSSQTQGFNGHFALAVSADGTRSPLGVVGLSTQMRARPPPRKTPKTKIRNRVRAENGARESLRWSQLALEVSRQLRGRAIPIHVMDREGDAYITLAILMREDQRFVIRARELARIVMAGESLTERMTLGNVVERSVPVSAREVQLSRHRAMSTASLRAKHPPRDARHARLEISAQRLRMPRSRDVLEALPDSIDLNIVHVREVAAPAGVEPVEWILFTTEPIATEEDVLRVVDHYRARWTIEEFFKAIKTGCQYEARQLESAHALLIALGLCIPIAWQMLALRHESRSNPTAAAGTVMSKHRLQVLRTIARTTLPSAATVKDVFFAIAALGGHIARNGPPGWITLRKGFDKLLFAEEVLAAAKSGGKM
jgi:hypothetical protein